MASKRTPAATKKLLDEGRQRWKTASTASDKQRQRELDDLRFLVDHWPADLRTSRAGQAAQAGMPPVPARPCIQVDKLSEPINRVLNQERQADIGVQVVPADDFAELGIELDDTEIEVREGLLRRIQRSEEAQDARTWAFKRAVQSGEGYYLIMTRFVGGKSFDKEIYPMRLYNQDGVRLDPAHEQPTGSDALWEFYGAWQPWDLYKAEHKSASKANQLADATDSDFEAFSQEKPEWVNITEGAKAVYVVMYWFIEMKSRDLVRLEDGSAVWVDEFKGDLPDDADIRTELDRTVHYMKLDGINDFPLEDEAWEGPDMPIIKIVGEEMQPYDGDRRVQGMVRPARDSQFGLDAMISKQVETVALTPIPPLKVDPVGIEGYESWYALANTRTLPYLPFRTYDDQGRQLADPSKLNADPNLLPIAQSIALFAQGIQDTTATSDPALGRTDPSVKSARHAQQLVDEANLSTSQYLDNFTRSLRYEGQVENNLLYPIYGTRKGRLVRILTGEGEPEPRRINVAQDAQNQQIAEKVGVLTKDAKFNVAVKLTKNSTLKRDAESSFVGSLIEANPEFMTWFGDLFFKNQDGPGHQQMAERAKAMLAPPIQKMLAEKAQGGEASVEALKAEKEQLEQRLQMAEQAMQELNEEANGKKIESETKLAIADKDAARDQELATLKADVEKYKIDKDYDLALTKAQQDNATRIRIAEIAAETKGIITGHELAHEADAMGRTQAHEAALQQSSQSHEATQAHEAAVVSSRDAEATREHEVAMAGAQAETSAEEAERGREHESELATTAKESE